LALIRASGECFKQVEEGHVDLAAKLNAVVLDGASLSCVPELSGVFLESAELEQIKFCLRLLVRHSIRLTVLNNCDDILEQAPSRPWLVRMHGKHEHVAQ